MKENDEYCLCAIGRKEA